MNDSREIQGPLRSILIGAACISFSPVFVQLVPVGPSASGFYRNCGGAVFLLLWALARRVSFRAGLRAYAFSLLTGFIFAVDIAFWHRCIEKTGPGLATILGNTQVFFMALYGAFFLKERLSGKFFLALPLAFLGLTLIVNPGRRELDADFALGILYGILTALSFAAYMISLKKAGSLPNPLDPIANITLVSFFSGIFLGLESFAGDEVFAPPDARSGLTLAAYAFLSQFLGWLLISGGLSRGAPAALAGLVILLQPSLAFLWDVLFFEQKAGPLEITGAVLTISAIYLAIRSRRGGAP